MKQAWVFLIGAVLLIGVGAFLVRAELGQRREAEAAATWPSTTARILTSQREKVYTKSSSYFRPDVTYEFQADGRTVTGKRISLYSQRDPDGTITARYPVGAETTVRYNPEDPSRSVLDVSEAGTRGDGFLYGGISIAIGLALALLGLVLGVKSRRGRTAAPAAV